MNDTDHEGKRLKKLLDDNGVTVRQLRDVLGVSDPAVRKYLNAPRLGAKAWNTLRGGLLKMKLNPNVVREPEVVGAARTPHLSPPPKTVSHRREATKSNFWFDTGSWRR